MKKIKGLFKILTDNIMFTSESMDDISFRRQIRIGRNIVTCSIKMVKLIAERLPIIELSRFQKVELSTSNK